MLVKLTEVKPQIADDCIMIMIMTYTNDKVAVSIHFSPWLKAEILQSIF